MDFETSMFERCRPCEKILICRLLIRTSLFPIQGQAGGVLGLSMPLVGNGDWREVPGGDRLEKSILGGTVVVVACVSSPWLWDMLPGGKTVAVPVVRL